MKKSRFTVCYSFLFADEWFQNLLGYIFQSYKNSMQPNEQKSTLRQKVSICMKHFWQDCLWKTYHFNCFVYIVQNLLRQRDSMMPVQFIHGKFIQNKAVPCRCFFRTFCFSLNLTGTLNLTKIVHYHWSRMGK